MALGTNDNNSRKYQTIQAFSQYKMSNTESKVDATVFTQSFWNHTLKLSISPMKPSNDDTIAWDYDNGISIYLNHTKARMFSLEIQKFLAKEATSVGVNSGNGCIIITNGAEYGVDHPIMTIRKIDPETGETVASAAYDFKTKYHYAIRNFEESNFSFDKFYYDTLELEQLVTLLEEYYKSMTCAIAYSVMEESKYNNTAQMNMVKSIAEKVGVELKSGGGNSYKSSNSAFNRKDNGSFGNSGINNPYNRSIDDIENGMLD